MTQEKIKTPLTDQIELDIINFLQDAKQLTNKTAAVRARRASLRLEKLFKAYRKSSIKMHDKRQ